MAKYSLELKLQAVLAYLEGKESFQEIAKRLMSVVPRFKTGLIITEKMEPKG